MPHSLGYESWVRICHSRHSFPYNGSWGLWNAGESWKLLGGGGGGGQRDAVALLQPPKADVCVVGNWRSCLIVAMTAFWNGGLWGGGGGQVAHLERVVILSSLGEFSILSLTAFLEKCFVHSIERETCLQVLFFEEMLCSLHSTRRETLCNPPLHSEIMLIKRILGFCHSVFEALPYIYIRLVKCLIIGRLTLHEQKGFNFMYERHYWSWKVHIDLAYW